MKKNNFIFLFVIILGLISFSCKQSSDISGSQYSKGLILYFGDPAVDGCGWMVQTNDSIYAPTNLDTKFQIDSLKVVLNFNRLNSTWNCGWRNPGYRQIKIIDIQKQ
jgi:hypothetical protein